MFANWSNPDYFQNLFKNKLQRKGDLRIVRALTKGALKKGLSGGVKGVAVGSFGGIGKAKQRQESLKKSLQGNG